MAFSGAVKIADNFDDFLAPSQKCIKPLMDPGASASAAAAAPGSTGNDAGVGGKAARVRFPLPLQWLS